MEKIIERALCWVRDAINRRYPMPPCAELRALVNYAEQMGGDMDDEERTPTGDDWSELFAVVMWHGSRDYVRSKGGLHLATSSTRESDND